MESFEGKEQGLELSAEPSFPPVSRVPHSAHGAQMASLRGKRLGSDGKFVKDEMGHRAQWETLRSVSHHSTTRWSGGKGAGVRPKACEERA